MANDSKQPAPTIGGNGFIWILLVAAGTYFVAHQAPLEGSRPPTTERSILERAGEQHIDARLWQDPFAAVAETLARSPELTPENCDSNDFKYKDIKMYCHSPLGASASVPALALVVSVSAAPYSEDQESRRRTRYAVLAGLDAEGFVPKDPQHIGFYWTRKEALPKVVPFEWFIPKSKRETLPYSRVLLLWFDEDALRGSPLKQFAEFLCPSTSGSYTTPASGSPAGWTEGKILGPYSSTTLQTMVNEVDDKDWSNANWSNGICPGPAPQFYISSATAGDVTLVPEYVEGSSCLTSDTCLGEFFRNKGIELHRMIATDEALARTIRDELRLRRVDNVKQNRHGQIALVSEWDTLYGRALPASMARCLGSDKCQQANIDPFADKPWLYRFKYLRGLDGQMPNVDGLSSGNSSKDTGSKQDKDTKDSTKSRPDPKAQDRAEGQGQFDYLRRLGERMQQLDVDLRRENQNGIEAVGVLGSDLYDKLLVLQALRPLLPNAWFFTTDLDALLLHPTAQTLTRNLLVASSFGLQLRPDIQREIPPFRSSYQTAQFLATRVAIHSGQGPHPARLIHSDQVQVPNPGWLVPPLLFEIGSSRVFQFAGQISGNGKPPESEDLRADHARCKQDLLKCDEIQPLASAMFPKVNVRSAEGLLCLGLGLGLCLALGFYPLRRRIWHSVDAFMRGSKSYGVLIARGLAILIALCVVILLLAATICALWPPLANWLTDGGQPITLLEGISVWPTIFLRMATLVLCIWLIACSWRRLDENFEKIAEDLHLLETQRSVKAEQDDIVRRSPPWIRFTSNFWYRLPADDGAIHGNGERLPQNVFRFWRVYIYQGRLTARLHRILAGVLAMAVLWGILVFVFGNPHPPTRGNVSLLAYRSVTFVLVFATLFLIFFVADTTLLCWRVVKAFRTQTNIWPARTLQEFSDRLGLPQSFLDDWIDLIFLSKRTKYITTLIYYPFLVIALLIVSRSRLFANYGASIPDLTTMGVGVLIVTACAVALRWSAEASRSKARRRLNDHLVAARSSKDEGSRAGQLEMLLHRVEELRDGAFSPFSQQPLVRAMLLPLGSLGGTALLEYLPLGLS
jgi:hypothetical protein